MCGSSTPAPDPYATASAQSQINTDALKTAAGLNQIKQTGPLGSISYSGDIGTPDRTQTTTLSPELQNLLTSQTGNTQALVNNTSGLINAMGGVKPFDPGQNPVQYLSNGAVTPLQTSYNPQMAQLLDARANNPLQTTFDPAGKVQRSLDFSGAPQLSTNFADLTNQAQNAEYNKAAQYLDPQFTQEQNALQSRLSAQGIAQGTDAYNQAMDNFARQKQSAYSDARNQAITAGDQLQGQLFGQNLAARQQAVGETAQQGQFGNAALAQQYAQNQGQAAFFNSAQGQQFNQGMDIMGYNLAALGQNNQANLANAQFGNQALGQQFKEGMDLNNFNQNLYQQNFADQQAQQTQNLNAIMALNNGQQISPTLPSYQGIPSSTAAQASPDMVGLAGSNYANALNANSSVMGSIFGGLGKLGSAAIGKWG